MSLTDDSGHSITAVHHINLKLRGSLMSLTDDSGYSITAVHHINLKLRGSLMSDDLQMIRILYNCCISHQSQTKGFTDVTYR